jgi:hypothetical protein
MNRDASVVTTQSQRFGICAMCGWIDVSIRLFTDSGTKKHSNSGFSRLMEYTAAEASSVTAISSAFVELSIPMAS